MKYKYHLIIEEDKEDGRILEIMGRGIARSEKGCLKSVRRSVNDSIKNRLNQIEETEEMQRQLTEIAEELLNA